MKRKVDCEMNLGRSGIWHKWLYANRETEILKPCWMDQRQMSIIFVKHGRPRAFTVGSS